MLCLKSSGMMKSVRAPVDDPLLMLVPSTGVYPGLLWKVCGPGLMTGRRRVHLKRSNDVREREREALLEQSPYNLYRTS